MTARTGRDPGEQYETFVQRFGRPYYERIDAPATAEQKAVLAKLTARDVTATELAGEPILQILTTAPAGNAPIGGIKVATEHGWFAARPSGTEDVYKLYAESFLSEDHLHRIQEEAQGILSRAFQRAS
jgi:phosphoglucomutase